MKGASQFVEKNFQVLDSTFENCLNAIVYGFKLVEKSKVYSRKGILNEASQVRSKPTKIIELEDYLRNDLVKNFISPNLDKFNLRNYLFIPGAEESSGNVRTGILDIKVCSPSFNGDVYFIFECKRFNKSLLKGYLNDGIKRFTTSKYYPDTPVALAGMISFLESQDVKNKIDIEDCFQILSEAIAIQKKELALIGSLNKHKLKCIKYTIVSDYKFVFRSSHYRKKPQLNIDLIHLMLDYNNLINE